jgi:hypothetical protein
MKTGKDIVAWARPHAEANDRYVFGAMTPVGAVNPHTFDCSKLVSCAVYQGGGVIYGTDNNHGDPLHIYGATIYWERDAEALGQKITVEQAMAILGCPVLRFVHGESNHHIVLSDGNGGTIEAASTNLGVIFSTLHGRRWTTGILVPGINYGPLPAPSAVQAPAFLYRYMSPLMDDPKIMIIQKALGVVADGIYGPATAAAVREFQKNHGGLITDGEVGPLTWAALGLNSIK